MGSEFAGLGLALGGGGIVGVSWEIGVLVGLRDSVGFDLRDAEVFVGTSAGSLIGARVLSGIALDDLIQEQDKPVALGNALQIRDTAKLMEVLQLWASPQCMTSDIAQKVGAIAMELFDDDSELVDLFSGLIPTDVWPERSFFVSAVNCRTGLPVIWSGGDGVGLIRAVSASCSVPGFFSPVTIDGERYMDGGVWSGSHADVVIGKGVRSALFIGPLVGETGVGRVCQVALETEEKLLADEGITLGKIVPNEEFRNLGANLMDPALRGPAFDIGIGQGKEAKGLVDGLIRSAGA